MTFEEPLPRPWRTARAVCCWGVVAAWTVVWVNALTADVDWIAGAALTVVVLLVVGIFPVTLLGRRERDRLLVSRSQSELLDQPRAQAARSAR